MESSMKSSMESSMENSDGELRRRTQTKRTRLIAFEVSNSLLVRRAALKSRCAPMEERASITRRFAKSKLKIKTIRYAKLVWVGLCTRFTQLAYRNQINREEAGGFLFTGASGTG